MESGIILNGHADKAVGGGISQFATTLYNAAYFAGMEDVAHTPHSYYISRYPAGREATVFEGAIDLQFKNTSPYPVRIVTSAGGGSVTVQLTGVKTVNVESVNGGRWNYTPPRPITLSGPDCAASSGAQGFTTSDTRIIRSLSGSEISRETKTTVYDPSPIVTCS
ncbi:putative secreted protein [Corynebacterium diphtheriae]|nr:putative secreted protein [Corynebacterium diphtheriae]